LGLGLRKGNRRARRLPGGDVLLQAGDLLAHDAERIRAERQVQRRVPGRDHLEDRLGAARGIIGCLPVSPPMKRRNWPAGVSAYWRITVAVHLSDEEAKLVQRGAPPRRHDHDARQRRA
jgi:hypothetical protein